MAPTAARTSPTGRSNEFRTHYSDPNITKWDIFHYVYAVLHHPEYRERYAANLKRELPRIPFVGGTADPSAALRSARDDNSGEGAGLQASRKDALSVPSFLPKASAQPKAERLKETGDPSTALRSARDDKSEGLGDDRGKPQRDAAVHHHETAGPSARTPTPSAAKTAAVGDPGSALARDDDTRGNGGDRGPSTPAAEPRAAFAQDGKSMFWRFAKAGAELADLHVNYEQQREYSLERVEKGQLNWRVEKMRLSKDKTSLTYNEFLTLRGIPPEAYEYRLGNRSALEWVIDQYQVSTDKRSGITNDPNRADDPEYIVRLIGQVITVSLGTMKVIQSLPALLISATSAVRTGKSAAG